MDDSTFQTPTFPAPEPDKHRQLPWLAVILSLLVLGIIGALALQNLQLKKQIGETPKTQVTTAVQPSPTPDPTADWKTYTNTKYEYSFKYPKELKLIKGPASDLPDEEFALLNNVSFEGTPKNLKDGFGISIMVGPADKDGKLLSCTTNERCLEEFIKILNTPRGEVTYMTKSIGDLKVKGFRYAAENRLYKSEYHYFIFPFSNNVWKISLYTNADQPNEIDSIGVTSVFDQILSTFKFTD